MATRTGSRLSLVSSCSAKVDVIVTTTAPAVRAAMQATTTIPIVVGGVDDAVEQGFVASLAKPGGNVTGTSWLNVELSEKRLDLLKQAMAGLSRIAACARRSERERRRAPHHDRGAEAW